MNNDWLNNLRSRMEDHEEDVPDGLWNDISNELFSGEEEENMPFVLASESHDEVDEKKDLGSVKTGQSSLWYRIGGIAAAVALLFVMMKILPQNDKEKVLSQKPAGTAKQAEKKSSLETLENRMDSNAEENLNLSPDISLAQNIFNAKKSGKALKQGHFKNLWSNVGGNDENIKEIEKAQDAAGIFPDEGSGTQKIASANEEGNVIMEEKSISEIPLKEQKIKEMYAENAKKKTLKSDTKRSWMLSMLTGNASPNSAEQQFPGYASINGKPMNIEQVWSTAEYEDNPDPLTEILLANQSQPVEARIRHKVPVTFGLSLYYSLGKRWGIGTGLNYTKLASELHSGSDANYIKGDQTVHYVGVPVQVNYNVIQKGRLTGYITGGALVEKPVSGSITTTYIVNDEIKETSKENLAHKPLQFSVNTAVGLQLKVIDRFGIYAEPGIGYHFKGENAPNTIYKEKPLHFNVKFGVRLLLD